MRQQSSRFGKLVVFTTPQRFGRDRFRNIRLHALALESTLLPHVGSWQLGFLLLAIAAMFASQGRLLIDRLDLVLLLAPALRAFYVTKSIARACGCTNRQVRPACLRGLLFRHLGAELPDRACHRRDRVSRSPAHCARPRDGSAHRVAGARSARSAAQAPATSACAGIGKWLIAAWRVYSGGASLLHASLRYVCQRFATTRLRRSRIVAAEGTRPG